MALGRQVDIPLVEAGFFKNPQPDDAPPWTGFDSKVSPPPRWLVVPTTGTKTAVLATTPTAARSSVVLTSSNPSTATVSGSVGTTSTLVTVTGHGRGHTFVGARWLSDAGTTVSTLGVCVRHQRVVRIHFHRLADEGHATTVQAAEIAAIVDGLNAIWTPQANIVFWSNSITSDTIPWSITNGEYGQEVIHTTAPEVVLSIAYFNRGERPGEVDVYFVWGWLDEYSNTGRAIGRTCWVTDQSEHLIPDLAHELGHVLGLAEPWADYRPSPEQTDELMASGSKDATLLRHDQVEQILDYNPDPDH